MVPDVLLFLEGDRRSFLARAKEHVKLWFRVLIVTIENTISVREHTTS